MARLQKPYLTTKFGNMTFARCARKTIGRIRISGYWVYSTHTLAGITRRSHLLVNPIWDTSKAIIFRCRRGNGHQGSIKGQMIQDQYAYFIPSSINNAPGQPARDAFAQAVYNWRFVLSDSQKIAYNNRAAPNHLFGYNLYISEYVKNNA